MEMSLDRIFAYLELFKINPDAYGYVCTVCGRKYKTHAGAWNHVTEKHCEEAIEKQHDTISKELGE